MARITSVLQFEGSVGELSAYKQKGSDKIILRTKGGASKRKIASSPRFALVRRNNKEFGGCSKLGAGIRGATIGLSFLADYNLSSPLNSIAKTIQKTNVVDELGKRPVSLSLNKDMIVGFNFNRQLLLDSVLRFPLQVTIDRENRSARITIPRIIPEINFKQYGTNTMFRLVASLGFVSDMVFDVDFNQYTPSNKEVHGKCVCEFGQWHTVREVVDEQQIVLQYPSGVVLTEQDTIVVAFGIAFGNPLSDSVVAKARYAGCGKIVGVG